MAYKQNKITMTVVMDEGEREVVLTFPHYGSQFIELLAAALYEANEVCSRPTVEIVQ